MAQGGQVFHREEAPVCQSAVQARAGVALGQDEPVPIRPLGALGVHAHFLEVQISIHIRGRQASAGMTGLGTVGSGDNALTHLHSHQLELLVFF